MKITYLGTTMLLFDDGQDQVLFDCHVTRPSLLRCGLGRFATHTEVADRVIRQFGIDRLRAIFVSHTHHDHVMDAPYFASRCQADIYGSPSAVNVALGGGISRARLHSYADAMQYPVGNYTVTVIPSIHSAAHWYNNDLGQVIAQPLVQPARKKDYKEGGSFDFLVLHSGKRYLIRPSYNYLAGQLNDIRADVLFLGVAGLSRDTEERRRRFYAETVELVKPQLVIPVHWDNFFQPLYDERRWMTGVMEKPENAIRLLRQRCEANDIHFELMLPLSTITL